MYHLLDTDDSGRNVSVNNTMKYIAAITIPRRSCKLSAVDWNCIEENFRHLIKNKSGEMTFEEFKKIVPAKKVFTLIIHTLC